MGIIGWIVIGGLAGWVASMIMKTDKEQGAIANILVGVVGALVGGWIMSLIGKREVMDFSFDTFLVALLGAVVFLGVLKLIRR